MKKINKVEEAREFCIKAHKGQFRRDGITPYSNHPIKVESMLKTTEEKIVALLHDVVEDCEGYYLFSEHDKSKFFITKENNNDTICMELSKEVYEALVLLTYSRDLSYSKYIMEIKHNNLAKKVKIADMFHNISDNASEKQKSKYFKALKILLGETNE